MLNGAHTPPNCPKTGPLAALFQYSMQSHWCSASPFRCGTCSADATYYARYSDHRGFPALPNTIAYITSWRLAGAGRFARIALIMVQAVSPVTSLCHILCFESHSKQIVVIRNSCISIRAIPNCELTSITMNPKF